MAKKSNSKKGKKTLPSKILLKNKISTSENIPLRYLFIISAVSSFVGIVGIIILKNNLPPEVPVFYGRSVGEERLGPTVYLIIPSLCSLFVTLVNFILSIFFRNQFLKKALAVTAVTTAIFSFITTVEIVLLVGSF